MIIREASLDDWCILSPFYFNLYRKSHPLQNKEFWSWQYGNSKYGRSFICINEQNEVVGHVGASFRGGVAWIINVYLSEEYRGKGILRELYALARNYYPLAATAANTAGLGLYKNMKWIRYHNLVRYVKINPNLVNKEFGDLCNYVDVNIENLRKKDTYYFKQPGLNGIILNDGSLAISQEKVGGLRIVDIESLKSMENQSWELGYNWLDYISSWNDLKTKELEANGWVLDFKSIIPWRLNPVIENYFCDITFLSEKPLGNEYIVHRSFSDHGRVGSI